MDCTASTAPKPLLSWGMAPTRLICCDIEYIYIYTKRSKMVEKSKDPDGTCGHDGSRYEQSRKGSSATGLAAMFSLNAAKSNVKGKKANDGNAKTWA